MNDQGTGAGDAPGFEAGGTWSSVDFEAALPLYVGGDLDAEATASVEAWLARHPESHPALAAARASQAVLEDHARSLRGRPTPDLWPSVRAELAQTGAFVTGERLVEFSLPSGGAQSSGAAGGGRVLGGARWFQRRSVAMAAAVLLVTSVGLMIGPGGGLLSGEGGDGSAAPAGASVAAETAPATFTGGPADVRLVGAPAQRGVPLRRPAGQAVHLIDHAPAGALWQAGAQRAVQVVPLGQAQPALAGGRGRAHVQR